MLLRITAFQRDDCQCLPEIRQLMGDYPCPIDHKRRAVERRVRAVVLGKLTGFDFHGAC
jgi:hypothetical protein